MEGVTLVDTVWFNAVWFGDDMASAEREHITRVWGQSPQRGPGAEPLVRGQGQSPLKLELS